MPRYGADQLSNAWPWLLLGALAFYGSYLLAVSQLRTATDADPLLGD